MIGHRIYTFVILLLISVCAFVVRAQQYTIHNLVGSTGPTCPQVNYIYLDPDSLLWLGTGNTVERYDGTGYLCYSFKEQFKDRGENIVSSIIRTHGHDYWVGNLKGLWKLNHQTKMIDRMFSNEINVSVNVLGKDENENLYVGAANGLYIYREGENLQHVRLEKSEEQQGNQIVDISVHSEKEIWLLLSEAVVFYNPISDVTNKYPTPSGSGYGRFTCCTRIGNILYIGTEKKGVITFDLRSCSYSPFMNEWGSSVSCLSYNAQDLLGVGTTNDGISLISLKEKKVTYSVGYDVENKAGLTSDLISTLLVYDNDIWVGTKFYLGWDHLIYHNDMISLYSCGDFTSRDIPIRSFLHTKDYTFIGTRDGFYVISEKDKKTHYFAMGKKGSEILRSNLIFSFYEYQGKYIVGTFRGGAYLFDTKIMSLLPFDSSGQLDNNDVFMYLTDEKGDLWIATLGGLYKCGKDMKIQKGYTPSNSDLPGNIVYFILLDSQQRFWVGTNKGLVLLNRQKEHFTTSGLPADFLKGEIVDYLYEDHARQLFFVTLDGKLFYTDKDMKQQHCLFDNADFVVENIIQDDDGNYWIGTSKGIIKADSSLQSFTSYSSTQKIPDLMLNSGAASVKDEEGRIWLANIKGLIIIDPRISFPKSGLQITEVIVNGMAYADISNTGISCTSDLEFDSKLNNITFRLASKGCSNISAAALEYILEGYDVDWITSVGKTEISYFNLPPGKYMFKVRKRLDNASMVAVPIVIDEKSRIWLWGTLGIVLLLFIYGVKIYIKKVKLRMQEKMKNVEEDSKEEKTVIKNLKISDAEAQNIVSRIKEYMENEKPYLDLDLKQSDVASAIGYSPQLLSQIFNQYLEIGYYDYVNTYRVDEFKRLVKEGYCGKYTLMTLAEMCGFKSQTSFFRTFKKFTGVTPNEYIHQQEKGLK